MTTIPINKYSLEEVSEITLLSKEEWEQAKKIPTVPKYRHYWWLRSPSYISDRACDVNYFGCADFNDFVGYTGNGVVPAFRIPNLKSEIGEKIFVENTICTVIDKDYAFADRCICEHRFDPQSNDYETSEIKQFINSKEFKERL